MSQVSARNVPGMTPSHPCPPAPRLGRWLRRHWRGVAATTVLTVVTTGGLAAPALAAGLAAKPSASASASAHASASASASASPCDAVVSDTTSTHVLRADSSIVKAAMQLEAKGADVRVRAFTTVPDGSLSTYEENEVAVCPSWGSNGELKPNLLLFLVSLDRNDAVFFGPAYNRLQSRVSQITAGMGKDFSKGDFAGGIAKAEQETYSALFLSNSSATQSSPHAQAGSNSSSIIIIIVLAVVIVGGGGFLLRSFVWRKPVG